MRVPRSKETDSLSTKDRIVLPCNGRFDSFAIRGTPVWISVAICMGDFYPCTDAEKVASTAFTCIDDRDTGSKRKCGLREDDRPGCEGAFE